MVPIDHVEVTLLFRISLSCVRQSRFHQRIAPKQSVPVGLSNLDIQLDAPFGAGIGGRREVLDLRECHAPASVPTASYQARNFRFVAPTPRKTLPSNNEQ